MQRGRERERDGHANALKDYSPRIIPVSKIDAARFTNSKLLESEGTQTFLGNFPLQYNHTRIQRKISSSSNFLLVSF